MSDTSMQNSGSPTPAESFVTGDNVTLFGAGFGGRPASGGALIGNALPTQLNAGQIGALIEKSPFAAKDPIHAGAPVVVTGPALLAETSDSTASRVVGLSLADFADGQKCGAAGSGSLLTLTAAQWDARTGGSGGLDAGEAYYVGSTGGALSTASTGTWCGIALSATTMHVLIGNPAGGT